MTDNIWVITDKKGPGNGLDVLDGGKTISKVYYEIKNNFHFSHRLLIYFNSHYILITSLSPSTPLPLEMPPPISTPLLHRQREDTLGTTPPWEILS